MPTYDAYVAREADRLAKFAKWLSDHGHAGKGMIGEFGWPNFSGAVKESSGSAYSAGSIDAWNKLGGYYLLALQKNNVSGTYWATGEYWGSNYGKLAASGNPISKLLPAGQILSDSPVDIPFKGINLSQHEFERSMGWPKAASIQFLASKGIKFFRVPFGWEDVQGSLNGDLVSGQVSGLKSMLDTCQQNGCVVVLDCHNYGIHNGTRCTGATLSDLWVKLVKAVGSHPALLGIDIMNEPNSENMGWSESQGFTEWGKIAQAVVSAVRGAGYDKRVYVETYQWSGIDQFARNFPNGPWISDPKNNTYYQAHHYFDTNGSSNYDEEYSAGLNKAQSAGYKSFEDSGVPDQPPPGPDEPPPPPPPPGDGGTLTISKPTVNTAQFKPGDTITAKTNLVASDGDVGIKYAVLTLREPGTTHADGPYYDVAKMTATTLKAGSTTELSGSFALPTDAKVGTWDLYATWQDTDGGWHDGESQMLTVTTAQQETPIEVGDRVKVMNQRSRFYNQTGMVRSVNPSRGTAMVRLSTQSTSRMFYFRDIKKI